MDAWRRTDKDSTRDKRRRASTQYCLLAWTTASKYLVSFFVCSLLPVLLRGDVVLAGMTVWLLVGCWMARFWTCARFAWLMLSCTPPPLPIVFCFCLCCIVAAFVLSSLITCGTHARLSHFRSIVIVLRFVCLRCLFVPFVHCDFCHFAFLFVFPFVVYFFSLSFFAQVCLLPCCVVYALLRWAVGQFAHCVLMSCCNRSFVSLFDWSGVQYLL